MTHKFIYVAAPMTGYPNYNRESINVVLSYLDEYSDLLIPLHTVWMPVGYPYERYMDIAFTLIDRADAILLLDGWRDSSGCCRELEYALTIGTPHFIETHNHLFREISFLPEIDLGSPKDLEEMEWLYD